MEDKYKNITVGVLALQGDFAAHIKMLQSIGVETLEIRLPEELDRIDGLIIPGGESTTLIKLMNKYGFVEALGKFRDSQKTLFGTCAGTILLASNLIGTEQQTLNLIDIEVERNAYGRQVDSFETAIQTPFTGSKPLNLIFIRAPIIRRKGKKVNTIIELDGNDVFVRENNVMAATFHPELTDDQRIHKYFLSAIKD